MEIFNENELERQVIQLCTKNTGRNRFEKAEELVKGYADCGYKVAYLYSIIDTYRLENGKASAF